MIQTISKEIALQKMSLPLFLLPLFYHNFYKKNNAPAYGIITMPVPEGYGNLTRIEKGKGSTSSEGYKKPKPNTSGKEGAKDVPSWAKGNKPLADEAGKDFAERLLDEKCGPGHYPKGPNSEFNKIKKWGDRSWQ